MEILASLHKQREEILDIADCHGAFNVRIMYECSGQKLGERRPKIVIQPKI